jgi:hypothetical protein
MAVAWVLSCFSSATVCLHRPTISKLRRAEIRAKSTKALHKVRRQSVGDQRLLEGELLASIRPLGGGGGDGGGDDGDGSDGDDGGPEPVPAAGRRRPSPDQQPSRNDRARVAFLSETDGATLAGGRCQVALKHGRLEIHAASGPPMQLQLLVESEPQLSGDGKQLLVEGTLSSVAGEAAAGRRALLTLALPPLGAAEPPDRKRSLLGVQLPSSLTRGLTGLTTSRSGPASGPSLHAWQAAIAKEVPEAELSLDEAEEELRKLRLAPILLPYSLRCSWWELCASIADQTRDFYSQPCH